MAEPVPNRSLTPGHTASQLGLSSCHTCGLVCKGQRGLCPCCHSALHGRKPDSLNRTWAYLLAAILFYIPANLLPMMKTRSLLGEQQDTLLSGILFLWQSGSWGLSIIVFIASVLVPLLKLFILLFLLLSLSQGRTWRPHQRLKLYVLLERVGRWSMLDIFVVALLVALVHLESLAVIEAGWGAAAFGAVVVLTMLASMSFDPRLIWDPIEE